MLPEITDEMLGAYVDQELDPAQRRQVEAAAMRSCSIRRRLDAIRRISAAVRAISRGGTAIPGSSRFD